MLAKLSMAIRSEFPDDIFYESLFHQMRNNDGIVGYIIIGFNEITQPFFSCNYIDFFHREMFNYKIISLEVVNVITCDASVQWTIEKGNVVFLAELRAVVESLFRLLPTYVHKRLDSNGILHLFRKPDSWPYNCDCYDKRLISNNILRNCCTLCCGKKVANYVNCLH